ncbi:MAG TPA: Hsp70 family protein [Friedmanniella sp.]
MGYRLGVDLGTTWTAAAVLDGARPTMVGLGNRALQIPSVVFVAADGELLVGEAAERRARSQPWRAAREFKRRFADPVPLYIAGQPYAPTRLTAEVLRWVLGRVGERLGEPPDALTITYPANWGPYRRSLLDEVCALAGVDGTPVTYCSEPEAAAAQYTARTASGADRPLLVYDLGGGTFDVCVLEARNGAYALTGEVAGLDDLGGIDFDEMIFQRVVEHVGPDGLDSAEPEVVHGLHRLRRECTDAKEALSSDVDVTIPVVLPGLDTGYRLTRRDFEEMIRPSVLRSVRRTRDALAGAGTPPETLQAIVLVGGSSRIPLVSELLERELGVPVAVDTHPKHDVALGAALTGGRTAGRAADVPTGPAPDGSGPPPRPGRRRRARPLVALAALVLLVVVGAVVLLTRGPTGRAAGPGPAPSPSGSGVAVDYPRSPAPLADDVLVWPRIRDQVWGIGTVSLSGKQGTVVADPSLDSSFPVLSPDRRSVVYLRETTQQWSLRVVGADGSGDRLLLGSLEGCRRVQAPAWGPGDVLALPCQKSSGSGTALELVTLDGHVVRILDRGNLGDPTFTRDGRVLVYWRNDDGPGDGGSLYRVAVDGGTPQRLTRGGDGIDNDPVIAPDGRTVAFRTERDGRFVIATIPFDPAAATPSVALPTVLSPRGSETEENPSWSPDGTRLAFVRGTLDGRDIWTMDADGSHRRPLVQDDEADSAPAWNAR